MSIEYPPIPTELRPPTAEGINLDRLWFELCMEMANVNLMGRTHGNRRTYDAGCGGPMCRRATREYARRRTSASAVGKYRWIDPILEFWFPIAEARLQAAQAKLLGQMLQSEEEVAS
jgi:hypothetical protein